jgi:Protein of unknown function (DUF3667)
MANLLGKVWNNTFHLEGKFLRSCWHLLVPGKVTAEYFKGKIDRYPHPIRMFAIVMFFFIILLNKTTDKKTEKSGSAFKIDRQDSSDFMERLKEKAHAEDLGKKYAAFPDSLRTPIARRAVDSLLRTISTDAGISMTIRDDKDSIQSVSKMDSMPVNLFGERFKVAMTDIGRYNAEEIIEIYGLEHWIDRMLIRQLIKTLNTPDALIHSYIGSASWAILALSALMAFFLKFLYWRQKRFYVEHFIFMLHYHTGVMLFAVLTMAPIYFGLLAIGWVALPLLFSFLGLFFALRRFYGGKLIPTLFKWFIFNFLYFLSFAVLFVLGMLLVFALF